MGVCGRGSAGGTRVFMDAMSRMAQRLEEDSHNRIYALASDLLDDSAVNALVMLRMDAAWTTCLGRRVMPLPTQDCACHRIQLVDAFADAASRSVVITEMSSSKVLQIKVPSGGRNS